MTKDPDKKPSFKEEFNRKLGLKEVLFILLLVFGLPTARFLYKMYEINQYQQMAVVFEKNKTVSDWRKLTEKEKAAYCYVYITRLRTDQPDSPSMLGKRIVQSTEDKAERKAYSKQCAQYINTIAIEIKDKPEEMKLGLITTLMLVNKKWSYLDD